MQSRTRRKDSSISQPRKRVNNTISSESTKFYDNVKFNLEKKSHVFKSKSIPRSTTRRIETNWFSTIKGNQFILYANNNFQANFFGGKLPINKVQAADLFEDIFGFPE